MNYTDIILLIVLCLGIVNGLRIGLIKSIINLAGWFVSLILVIKYHRLVANLWVEFSDQVWQQQVLAILSIVICVMLMTWGIIFLLDQVIRKLKLTPINRAFGGLFGGAKSLVVMLLLLNMSMPILEKTPIWRKSYMLSLLLPHAPMVTDWSKQIAKQMQQQVDAFVKDENPSLKIAKPSKSATSSHEKSTHQHHEIKNPFSS